MPGSALGDLGLEFEEDRRPAVVRSIGPRSPLFGRVAPGAKLVAVDGVDLTPLTATEVFAVFHRLQGVAFALRFLTPRRQTSLADERREAT